MTGLAGLRSEFDNRFRGTTAVIRQRLDQYVGILDLGSLGRLGTAVDLGCGRGEWLDLLADHHVPAYGVELDDDVAAGARTRGHDIRAEDALAHLREVATGSLGLVTMFHLAEHLPFGTLLEVLREAHRTLASGGVLVVETPNPTNLVVGAAMFYIDPTHLRPLPPELLEFLGTAAGFESVQVVPLNPPAVPPFSPPASLAGDAAMERLVAELNRVLLGPMDAALIATKDSRYTGVPVAGAGADGVVI